LIVQTYVDGIPASVSFLTCGDHLLPLVPARQHISEDGRFGYLGGEIPLPEELATRAVDLARRAITGIPGLRGYIGVDLVLGADPTGAKDYAIEINPRLTTSYIGLRALAESNLAEAMLDMVQYKQLPELRWKNEGVRFKADGEIIRLSEKQGD
jgi:predicted ATP-grasp superfamily ATP-dependent carboligase